MASRLRNNPPTFIDSPSRRPAWKWATSKEQTEHSNESKTIYSAPRHLGQSVSCKLAGETSRVRYAKPQLLKMQRIETSFCNRFQRCNWKRVIDASLGKRMNRFMQTLVQTLQPLMASPPQMKKRFACPIGEVNWRLKARLVLPLKS